MTQIVQASIPGHDKPFVIASDPVYMQVILAGLDQIDGASYKDIKSDYAHMLIMPNGVGCGVYAATGNPLIDEDRRRGAITAMVGFIKTTGVGAFAEPVPV